ncbi:hypothetical protein PLESTF_001790200 [Pleodorina starrii]|nr:hypothetical protein PLESTF_001790200 [Pleodorina starrii]
MKVEDNEFSGTLPSSFGDLPNLRVLRLESNRLYGTIPSSLSKLSGVLNGLELANNNFQGDLSALATARPMYVSTHNNPGLCGMVPAGIRFAHGFNPYGTRLGQPC